MGKFVAAGTRLIHVSRVLLIRHKTFARLQATRLAVKLGMKNRAPVFQAIAIWGFKTLP
jgi:hypothetical protein